MVIMCAVCGMMYTAVHRDGKLFPREHVRIVSDRRYIRGANNKYVKESGTKICEGSQIAVIVEEEEEKL